MSQMNAGVRVRRQTNRCLVTNNKRIRNRKRKNVKEVPHLGYTGSKLALVLG